MDERETLLELARRAAREGLLVSTCGNASLRLDSDRMLISGSGTELGTLEACQLAVVEIEDGRVLDDIRPSSEHPLHRYIYRSRPETGVVLHYQSRAATVLAAMEDPPDNLDFIPEIPAYVKSFRYVPYATPGSERLARAVAAAFAEETVGVVQMQNHGQVVVARSPEAAVQKALFFELAAWMFLQEKNLRRIPAAEADLLRAMKSV